MQIKLLNIIWCKDKGILFILKIYLNRIQCRKCKDIITSEGVHDFQICRCGDCGVDGGRDYLKRMGKKEDYIELSKYEK